MLEVEWWKWWKWRKWKQTESGRARCASFVDSYTVVGDLDWDGDWDWDWTGLASFSHEEIRPSQGADFWVWLPPGSATLQCSLRAVRGIFPVF